MAPSYIKGIINLRGTVLPVIDLRLKLGMPAFQKTANTCIIVLDITIDKDPVQIGAIVDSVQAVHEIDKSVILAPPSIGSKYRSEFIVGVANINDSFIMVLDMDSIFSLDEIADFQNQIDNITHIEKIETIE
jgi:purine-binding chemotaxis protein CheW